MIAAQKADAVLDNLQNTAPKNKALAFGIGA
jgi:hypothetical protein